MRREWTFDFFDAVYEIATVINIGLGTAIVVGGNERFPLPTYSDILIVAHGHSQYWGAGILLCGLLMMVPHIAFEVAGLILAMIWHNMFGALFFTALRFPTTASTAWVAYFSIALLCASLATERLRRYRLLR